MKMTRSGLFPCIEMQAGYPLGQPALDAFQVKYTYANGVVLTCEQTPTGTPSITYYGSAGWIKVDAYPGNLSSSNPQLLTRQPEPGELDFSKTLWDKNDLIAAIREHRQPLEPSEVGDRSLSIAQIGLIACQVQDKLHWNPEKGLFEGNTMRTLCWRRH